MFAHSLLTAFVSFSKWQKVARHDVMVVPCAFLHRCLRVTMCGMCLGSRLLLTSRRGLLIVLAVAASVVGALEAAEWPH